MSLANLPFNILTAIVFLAMISILVAAHEYGHFFFARVFGMGVEEFAIGFGKKLKVWRVKEYDVPVANSYTHNSAEPSKGALFEGGSKPSTAHVVDEGKGQVLRDTTEFTIRALPIGGFVRIKGMVPQDDGSEVEVPGGFYSKPPWQRLIVLLAGPAASVVSGLIVLICIFLIQGVPKASQEPVLEGVTPGSIAAAAGLQAGDRIVAVDDRPITATYEYIHAINSNAGKKIKLQYIRGHQGGSVVVTPNSTDGPTFGPDLELQTDPVSHGVIGVAPKSRIVPVGLIGATAEAIRMPVEAVAGMFRIAKKPSSLKDEAGGAIMMVRATHDAVEAGVGSVVTLAALLSISVGIFNLLPIPPLDGGQMAMAFAEMLRGGRRLSIKIQSMVTSAGIVLVLAFAAIVMVIDIQRVTGPPKSPASAPPPVSSKAK